MYDKGINESVVGKALLKYQQRDDIFIGTKSRQSFNKRWQTTWDPKQLDIKEAVKGSLKRLGIDHIDYINFMA